MVRASALRTQNTSGTHPGGRFIFERPANGMQSAGLECLASRTAVNVAHCIVSKGFIAKDALVAPAVGFAGYISHVRSNPTRLTGHVVLTRAILVIGHHGLHLAARVFLVLIDQAHELLFSAMLPGVVSTAVMTPL